MAAAFIKDYCVDPQWAYIARNSENITDSDLFGEKAFAFGDYTPCVADGAILSLCYFVFIVLASIRIGQLCSRQNLKGKVTNKGRMCYRFGLILLIWLVCVFQLVKDYVVPRAPDNTTLFGDVYMLQPMAPFQIVSRALSVLGWGLLLIVAAIETSVFTPAGNWMSTFLGLLDLLCELVKLYVVLTLYLSVPDSVAQQYVGIDMWVFVAQLSLTLLLALLPMCGRPHMSAEFEAALATKVEKSWEVQMQDPLLPGDASEVALVKPENAGPFPEYKTNIVSRICFCWVCPILRKGKKSALQFSDIWVLQGNDLTDNAAQKFSIIWENEKRTKAQPSLNRAICKANCCLIVVGGILQSLSIASSLVCPIFIQLFSTYLAPSADGTHTVSDFFLYMLAVGFFCAQVGFSLGAGQYQITMGRVGMRIRSAMLSQIFDKSLKISAAAKVLPSNSVGKLNNLMQGDTATMQFFTNNSHRLWSTPVQILIALALLYTQLGWISFLAVGVMACAIPVTLVVSKRMMLAFYSIKIPQDMRLNALDEALQAMDVVKFYCWEMSAINKIMKHRDDELAMRWKAGVYQAWFGAIAQILPVIVSLLSFGVLAVAAPEGKKFDAGTLFTSLSYFQALNMPLAMLPILFSFYGRYLIASKRVESFLVAEERESLIPAPEKPAPVPVRMEAASFQWKVYRKPTAVETEKTIQKGKKKKKNPEKIPEVATDGWGVSDVDLEVKQGELVCIVGETGDGKSSLLAAVTGDMPLKSGTMKVEASMAYVPQESWVFNGTVRENVLFGKEYDEQKYLRALHVSCLRTDIENMDFGDETELGAKGVNMSGGQRQRLSIARAVYADAQLYLLDDCLSALDAHVARDVYERCILGYLRGQGKTVLFVTNRMEFVEGADKIVCLEHGRIAAQGDLQLVKNSSSKLRKMLSAVNADHHDMQDESKKDGNMMLADHTFPPLKIKQSGDGAKLVQQEGREEGSISWSVIKAYYDAFGGGGTALFFIVVLFLSQAVATGNSFFLAIWGESAGQNGTSNTTGAYIGGYAGLGVMSVIATLIINFYSKVLSIRASTVMHKDMLERVLRTPMSFFHANPVGRITNRFSKDIADVDKNSMPNLQKFIQSVFSLVGSLILMCTTTVYTTALVVPMFFGFFFVVKYFQASNLEVKRLDSLSRGPIFSQFSECINGIESIRVYRKEDHELRKSASSIDKHIALDLLQQALNQWLNVQLSLLGSLMILGCCVFAVAGVNVLGPSLAIMAIQTSTSVSPVLASLLTNWATAEQGMNAVERVEEYTKVELEKYEGDTDQTRPDLKGWPQKGGIEYSEAVARYRADLNPILQGLSVEIKGGENVGICGRTGAGKSTLFLTLFRILELDSGFCKIDGIDISTLNLTYLRSKLSIIPQVPVLFNGTLRSNLDPYDEHTDEELLDALERANLGDYVRSGGRGLRLEVASGGTNFSAGQRQLLCLARALLRHSKILILDEATASIDVTTDELIQETIRKSFSHCTILAIAHRLNTIIDSDKILVLDFGQLKEFGSPKDLLADPHSQFSSMVDETGEDNAEVLRRRANGEHVDENLMARVRESHAKERKAAKKRAAESLDTNDNSDTGGGASAQANESNDSHTSIKGWNLIKRMHTQFGIHGLDGSRTVDAHLNPELREIPVPLNPTPELVRLRLQDLDVAMHNLLNLEDALAGCGTINIEWIQRMQNAARNLDFRASERLLALAHKGETDSLMNREGNADQFGLISS
jgi:ABC-type multidrug transport system fused ATPase/permease subunit